MRILLLILLLSTTAIARPSGGSFPAGGSHAFGGYAMAGGGAHAVGGHAIAGGGAHAVGGHAIAGGGAHPGGSGGSPSFERRRFVPGVALVATQPSTPLASWFIAAFIAVLTVSVIEIRNNALQR
jgi:hypothetical protein